MIDTMYILCINHIYIMGTSESKNSTEIDNELKNYK